ncbi:hypothetical protein C5167_017545 [Papaver somniferum]|uniref:Uncharacterized protein n=1 Tax=Papaver somniferum TaxID=3469 RepID=A0A4Y7IN43_PAPSO|nr:hypothetical protein C5167_017545 [Papaver somniferum]
MPRLGLAEATQPNLFCLLRLSVLNIQDGTDGQSFLISVSSAKDLQEAINIAINSDQYMNHNAVESSTLSKDEAEVKGASNPNMSWLHEALRVAFIVVDETLKEVRVHIDYSKLVNADDNGKDKVIAPYRPEYQVAEEIKWYNINTNCKIFDSFQKAKLSADGKKGGVRRQVDKLRKDKTHKMDVNVVHCSSQVFKRLLLPMNAKLFKENDFYAIAME